MANIKSQKKRILTNEKARMRNRAVRSQLKSSIREVYEAAEAKDGSKALTAAYNACKLLDRAVTKGVIHKNQAANRKSEVMKAANSVATDADRKAFKAPDKKTPKKGTVKADKKAARAKKHEAAEKQHEKNQTAEKKAAQKKAAAEKKAAEAEAKEEAAGENTDAE